MALMSVLTIAIVSLIYTKYQVNLIEERLNQIDNAFHVFRVKQRMLYWAGFAGVLFIGLEMGHHAVLEFFRLEVSHAVKLYLHDFTDLGSLVLFLFVLRPRPHILYFDTINIDTIGVGDNDNERV